MHFPFSHSPRHLFFCFSKQNKRSQSWKGWGAGPSSSTASGVELVLGSADSSISGTIVQSDGSAMEEEVYVYAWSSKGQAVEGNSSSDGSYTLKVPSGAIWYVGADYQKILDNGTPKNFKTAKEVSVDLTSGAQTITGKTLAIFEHCLLRHGLTN